MAAPLLVKSVPWMPERAWTTCVSNGAISGLARSNYVPFAPQPLPPGMTEAMYELLDPAPILDWTGSPPPDDCFPRYVMWREERIPDFDGGQPRIDWTRNLGWDYRNDCVTTVIIPPPPLVVDFTALPNPVDIDELVTFTPLVTGGTGPFTYAWEFELAAGTGSTLEIPTHSYPTSGTKHVTLTVTDSLLVVATAEHDVVVNEPPPPASVYFTWDQMTEDTLLFFDMVVVGSLDVIAIDWDFGEGAGWELDLGEPIVNVYPGGPAIPEGTYTVKVRVTAVEGIFEDEAEMTTNYAFGQSGSSL